MTGSLEVEYVDIDMLTPYRNNAKRHPNNQVQQIARSIREFGMNDPLAVWTNERGELEIVEGHGRLYAMDMLGIRRVPIIRLDGLTDVQRRAYAHVHNQLTMDTGWDRDILDIDLDELSDSIDLSCYFDIEENANGGDEEIFRVTVTCRGERERSMLAEALGVHELGRRYDASDLFG